MLADLSEYGILGIVKRGIAGFDVLLYGIVDVVVVADGYVLNAH